MGQFTLERKSDSTGAASDSVGYYLLYNGQYVMRQQANEAWVRFETQDANFNPDYFEVMNNDTERKTVRAKFLAYKGEYGLGPGGNPYIVPYTFDFEAFIKKYQSFAIPPSTEGYVEYIAPILGNAFRQGGIDDLQRSYDGTHGRSQTPFMSFTAAASFVYGVASSIMGLDQDSCRWAGGKFNELVGGNNNKSGEYSNNPNNIPNISQGYKFVDSLRSPLSRLNRADTNDIIYDLTLPDSSAATTVNPVSTTLGGKAVSASTASPNTPVDFDSTTFTQKWQYNFETILGPTNPAFVHAEPTAGYTLEYNPNGVLWNVNAAGVTHLDDFNKYAEQQRVIESATKQTIAEMYTGN